MNDGGVPWVVFGRDEDEGVGSVDLRAPALRVLVLVVPEARVA